MYSRLCASGLIIEKVTTAVIFRSIHAKRLTLLIDEYGSLLRNKEELPGVLNANQKRGGCFLRCEGEVQASCFKTFTLIGLLGIGSLPSTLVGRSFIIYVQRAKLASYGNTSAPNARRRTNKS
jgi:hypothetical protein